MTKYDHVWRWRSRLPERKGQRCAVLIRSGRMNSCLVEFEDGFRAVTSRWAVKLAARRNKQQEFKL